MTDPFVTLIYFGFALLAFCAFASLCSFVSSRRDDRRCSRAAARRIMRYGRHA